MFFKVFALFVAVATIVEGGPTPQFLLPVVPGLAPAPAYDPYDQYTYAYQVQDPITVVVAEHVGETAVAPLKDVTVDPLGVIAHEVPAIPTAALYNPYYPNLYQSAYGAYSYPALVKPTSPAYANKYYPYSNNKHVVPYTYFKRGSAGYPDKLTHPGHKAYPAVY